MTLVVFCLNLLQKCWIQNGDISWENSGHKSAKWNQNISYCMLFDRLKQNFLAYMVIGFLILSRVFILPFGSYNIKFLGIWNWK